MLKPFILFVLFAILILLHRLFKIDNIYFKNAWFASIVAIIITIIGIVISMFI
jgi:hypothetical protein